MKTYRVYDMTGSGVTHDIEAASLADAVEAGREWIEDGNWESNDGTIRIGVELAACVREVTTRAPRPDLDPQEDMLVRDILALDAAAGWGIRGLRYRDLDRRELEALADYLEDDEGGSLDGDMAELCRSVAVQIRESLAEDDEDITDDQPATDCSGTHSDDEPECESDGPGDDGGHDWRAPHALVGGIRENPGVWSCGGTAMRYETVCACCGRYRTEVRAGSNRNPGEPKATVTYRDADEASEAWLVEHHEDGGWIPQWLAEQLGRSPTTRYTPETAREWVAEHQDDDDLDDDDLGHVFAALHGRRADDRDREEGLWSLCVAAC